MSINNDKLEKMITKGLLAIPEYQERFMNIDYRLLKNETCQTVCKSITDSYINDKKILSKDEILYKCKDLKEDDLAEILNLEINNPEQLTRDTMKHLITEQKKNVVLDLVDVLSGHSHESEIELVEKLRDLSLNRSSDKSMYQILNDLYQPTERITSMEIPELKYYLYPIIREESIILISGDSGIGKTQFVHQICKSVTENLDFLNWQTKDNREEVDLSDIISGNIKSPTVCYIDGELPLSLLKQRLLLHNLNNNVFPISCSEMQKNYGVSLYLNEPESREALLKILTEKKPDIVIFDNLASLCPGLDENSKKDYDPINQFALKLRHHGITTILIHHHGKSGNQRGTSARIDNIDTHIVLSKHKDRVEDGVCRFIFSLKKFRDYADNVDLIKPKEIEFSNGEWKILNNKISRDNLKCHVDVLKDIIETKKEGNKTIRKYTIGSLKERHPRYSIAKIRNIIKLYEAERYIETSGSNKYIKHKLTDIGQKFLEENH